LPCISFAYRKRLAAWLLNIYEFDEGIDVEMIPCDEAPTEKPVKADDGSVSMILSETDALSIDACEKALLETTYPVLRETLATHLSDMAKKRRRNLNLSDSPLCFR
jgi:hypothetical protein